MKTSNQSLVGVTFVIVTFAFQPMAEAVLPPPDGGYPGFNTAEGDKALFGLTTGIGNTAVGCFRSSVTLMGASTPLSVQARFFSTSETKLAARERETPPLVPPRF